MQIRSYFQGILAAGAALLIWSAAGAAQADDAPTGAAESVTYSKHIAPILNRNCAECHRPDQAGPMSLMNYKEVRPWAKSIRKAVESRAMPPWFASEADAGKFKEERGLTSDEIALISRWVDDGAPQGDPADMPEPAVFDDSGWAFGTPDHIFKMVEPFHVNDDIVDYYHHTTIPAGFAEDRWVKAVEIKPDSRSTVHHILVFTMPRGSDPTNVEANMDLLAGYGPGTNADVFEPGFGKKIPAGHDIVFQVHYHKEAGPGTAVDDQSSMGLLFAEGPVEHPVTTAWILNPKIDLAPGNENYELKSTFRFIDSGKILSLTPHMHLRGKSAQFVAEYPDGRKEVLLNVPKYDFNWQVMYHLKKPIEVPRGTKVHFLAQYDNSTNNPYNPDPAAHVSWGDASTDEMMIGYMNYIYDRKKDFQRIIALPEGMINSGWGDGNGHGDGHKHEWNKPKEAGS